MGVKWGGSLEVKGTKIEFVESSRIFGREIWVVLSGSSGGVTRRYRSEIG
jgi:hypothetical protein